MAVTQTSSIFVFDSGSDTVKVNWIENGVDNNWDNEADQNGNSHKTLNVSGTLPTTKTASAVGAAQVRWSCKNALQAGAVLNLHRPIQNGGMYYLEEMHEIWWLAQPWSEVTGDKWAVVTLPPQCSQADYVKTAQYFLEDYYPDARFGIDDSQRRKAFKGILLTTTAKLAWCAHDRPRYGIVVECGHGYTRTIPFLDSEFCRPTKSTHAQPNIISPLGGQKLDIEVAQDLNQQLSENRQLTYQEDDEAFLELAKKCKEGNCKVGGNDNITPVEEDGREYQISRKMTADIPDKLLKPGGTHKIPNQITESTRHAADNTGIEVDRHKILCDLGDERGKIILSGGCTKIEGFCDLLETELTAIMEVSSEYEKPSTGEFLPPVPPEQPVDPWKGVQKLCEQFAPDVMFLKLDEYERAKTAGMDAAQAVANTKGWADGSQELNQERNRQKERKIWEAIQTHAESSAFCSGNWVNDLPTVW